VERLVLATRRMGPPGSDFPLPTSVMVRAGRRVHCPGLEVATPQAVGIGPPLMSESRQRTWDWRFAAEVQIFFSDPFGVGRSQKLGPRVVGTEAKSCELAHVGRVPAGFVQK